MQNLPLFLENLEEVESIMDSRSTWRFRSDIENQYTIDIPMVVEFGTVDNGFVWQSEDKAGFKYSIAIQLEPAIPADRGTVVRMMVMYDSIAGDFVGLFEKLFGDDATVLSKKNLHRLKALCWEGRKSVSVKNVREPKILRPDDVIIKITTSAICGSDLHLYNGYIPTMKSGDILGHENMGIVVEVGPAVKKMKIGDKIVVSFDIGCGHCHHCEEQEYSACDNSNPNSYMVDALYGSGGAGLFGFSHMQGGYAGGQAEYLRVPYADTNSLIVPSDIEDEKVLFLSDIFLTGWMAAENCNIKRGDTVAIWGAGPVGQMAIRSAFLLGAERVISIDHIKERLKLSEMAGAETVNFDDAEDGIIDEINYLTGGVGPDSCIDAVGLEAHGHSVMAVLDRTKAAIGLATDRPDALRQSIQTCRKGGTVSVPGVYGGVLDKMPFGAAFGKGLKFNMGQTHTQKYMQPLLEHILAGRIDPSIIISHRISIDQGPEAYKNFDLNKEDFRKVVIKMH